ncbi:hypothetical protein [Novosphingobium profundi]|uniref:hypothetical protein n=1 Tax=Novosphingobium profundi TaxID=1774954 RepID=UPI001CFE1BD9|nr:hypothetical protein [Novosphingobium profundi]MED5544229.1 hypothetical protein [Pseudomonadota bacterium]
MATPPKSGAGDKLRQAWQQRQASRGPERGRASEGQPSAKAPRAPHAARQPSRWLRNLVVLALLVGAGLLAWQWADLRERTRIGGAYAARLGCVCRHVSQRDLKSCEADLAVAPLGGIAGRVWLSEDTETRSVSAGLPLLGYQSARYDSRHGCRLEPWDG